MKNWSKYAHDDVQHIIKEVEVRSSSVFVSRHLHQRRILAVVDLVPATVEKLQIVYKSQMAQEGIQTAPSNETVTHATDSTTTLTKSLKLFPRCTVTSFSKGQGIWR